MKAKNKTNKQIHPEKEACNSTMVFETSVRVTTTAFQKVLTINPKENVTYTVMNHKKPEGTASTN